VWARPGSAGSDALVDLEARKRRIVGRSTIAKAASPASQNALVEAGSVQRVERGRMLFSQGDGAASVALLGLGRVRLVRATSDGKNLLVGYRGAGDTVGEAALASVAAHKDSAVATEDVDALLVPAPLLRQVMTGDAAFCAAVVASLVERQGETEERLASLLFRDVEGRLADFLLKAAARWGIPDPRGVLISAPFTHQEMASMIGSTRETVTLTLGDLRRKGILEVDRRRVVVLDRERLKALT
jgi:CRP-like cAMP-binding protein